jgi:hypothetical protein
MPGNHHATNGNEGGEIVIEWTFAANDGGRDNGLNDPGVETFKGNFDRYLARELGQNSLDARDDHSKPVRLVFELIKFDRKDIPGIEYLQDAFIRSARFWEHDAKALTFFTRAETLARARTITLLRIGDYNTTGLLGDDKDKTLNWYNLIRCAGASSKYGGEGGSYGIGKKAPFAASHMRTVLYSTYNTDSKHAFIGVCDGATHVLPGRRGKAQGVGFLGNPKGATVRRKEEIPPQFLRTEHGTDVFILGFPAEESWEKDLVYSVLDNFWPAIHNGTLEVQVGSIKIDKNALPALLANYSVEDEFAAPLYYQAYTAATHTVPGKLPRLGEVKALLLTGDASLPKRVAMVRKTGMVIFTKAFRSIVPYCGVFECTNKTGNLILRDMEPPKHDTWDPNHPEKGKNKSTETEYVNFLRSAIASIAPAEDSNTIIIPGLARFLPDDEDTPEEDFASEESAKSEGERPAPLPGKIEPSKIDSRKRSMQPDEMKPEGAEDETEMGDGQGTGGGPGKGKGGAGGGAGAGGGGRDKGRGDPTSGGHGGVSSRPSVPIKYRSYCQDAAARTYVLAVTPEATEEKQAKLIVWTVGDDQKHVAEIKTAKIAGGGDVTIEKGGILGPLAMQTGVPLRLEITLRHPQRVAMEVSAHEA